jgi:flagellar hook-basal body complex protein FliE
MRVDVLVPDAAVPDAAPARGSQSSHGGASAFARLVDAAGAILENADRAEAAFAAHRGGLQEMVVERARADVALQIAATAAQRTAQSLSALLGMQL